MLIRFQFFKADGLFIHKFSGRWSSEIYKDYICDANSHPIQDKPEVKKVLTDLRDLEIENIPHEFLKVRQITNQLDLHNYINVHVVNSPNLTAIIHLYQNSENINSATYNYCSTIEYAIRHLELPYTPEQIEKMIENLENSCGTI